jgi:D-arabinose 1-dehydrogenase-like Zn-dependent alcohol dehydrogenase
MGGVPGTARTASPPDGGAPGTARTASPPDGGAPGTARTASPSDGGAPGTARTASPPDGGRAWYRGQRRRYGMSDAPVLGKRGPYRAVGLLAVLSARQMGAERIIAMSRHEPRQELAREFGATDIVTEREDEGIARIKELTKGVGADSVLECVGTPESMKQALGSARPGGYVSYVGVPHGVQLDGQKLFLTHVHLHGGPAPVRRYLPRLIELIEKKIVDPGKVFDLTLPLEKVADGYRAMDERRAIKTLLQV